MKTLVRPAIVVFVALTLLTGVAYPLLVTVAGRALFPRQASGSLFYTSQTPDKPIGSELIGQAFSAPKYFWGRPSATAPVPCNAAASTGSNLGPTNPAQLAAVEANVQRFRQASGDQTAKIPVDLATASASGLDPHITPAAAEYQVERIASARGLSANEVRQLVAAHVEGRLLGVLGEPRVNVLTLNLALDASASTK